jgi:hypothetical protein
LEEGQQAGLRDLRAMAQRDRKAWMCGANAPW